MTKTYAIYPAIGLARVGSSSLTDAYGNPTTESYFVGPEVLGFGFSPGAYAPGSETGAGMYRDGTGAIRRQGARFRIYENEETHSGQPRALREITLQESDIASIAWRIQLANRKAMGRRFPPYHQNCLPTSERLRNNGIRDSQGDDLVIEASGVVTSGSGATSLSGSFLGEVVKLADLIVEQGTGRLVVLGGHGRAINPKNELLGIPHWGVQRHSLYNNDFWGDDTSDGIISAEITFQDGRTITLDQSEQVARVIVAPPNFAPATQSPITLYDVVYQANIDRTGAPAIQVSFTRDIYPMLRRAVDLAWVSKLARMGHDEHDPGNFLDPNRIQVLASTAPEHEAARRYFVSRLTKQGAEGDHIDMPDLYGGVDPHHPDEPPFHYHEPSGCGGNSEYYDRRDYFGVPLTITPHQRQIFEAWAAGNFAADWQGEPELPSFEQISVEDQPDMLNQAALDEGSGGSFHPGIEGPYIMARSDTYRGWFRVTDSIGPGELTQIMAVPWQFDFIACTALWWPGQRPNNVPVKDASGVISFQDWERDIDFTDFRKGNWIKEMEKLGFVKYVTDASGKRTALEQENEFPLPAPGDEASVAAEAHAETVDGATSGPPAGLAPETRRQFLDQLRFQ